MNANEQHEALETQLKAHFGEHWYLRGASEQALREMAMHPDRRVNIIHNLRQRALSDAMQVLRAGICAGLVSMVE